ncbi:MAG: hypothetical protein EAY81_11130 [Bacteroidetes bacterium]|nr:MAG: hypothetical protein EAY81_11130 [Bacteroidota bacterium]
MKALSLLFLVMCCQFLAIAQHNEKVKITGITKTATDLVVNYQILDDNAANKYVFTVKLVDSNTFRIIKLTQVNGDVNEVTGGSPKTLRIPMEANGLDAKTNYGVLFTNLTYHTIMVNNKAVLKSVLVPGLGNKYLYKNGGAMATSIAIASYGCIAYGVISKMQAEKSYKNYQDAFVQSDIDKHFKDANNGQSRFVVFTGIGLGIWALDIIQVALKVKSGKKTTASTSPASNVSFGYVPPVQQLNGTSQFSITYKF